MGVGRIKYLSSGGEWDWSNFLQELVELVRFSAGVDGISLTFCGCWRN